MKRNVVLITAANTAIHAILNGSERRRTQPKERGSEVKLTPRNGYSQNRSRCNLTLFRNFFLSPPPLKCAFQSNYVHQDRKEERERKRERERKQTRN